jgi:predicted Zn-dependent peptidase
VAAVLLSVVLSRSDAAFITTNSRTLVRSPSINSDGGSRRSNIILRNEATGDSKKRLTLSSLFGGGSVGTSTSEVKHPSVRPHRSPLNLLSPENILNHNHELPIHPEVFSGVLDNGLSYVILPNRSPPGRFEAHLQVFSGSSDELDAQQGIAHLTEHVAYMGSRKRERLFGTGSQTNAYTDFHHTVFYAACPTTLPGSADRKKMLPLALDALADVMEARVEPSRLEKERAAVLSEMTMVNTIEYRVECQILSALHRENRLSKRFPIGKEILIKNWQTKDVKTWHRTHYRPDNVLLYIVGDIVSGNDGSMAEVIQTIQDKFGHITADKQAIDISPPVMAEASQIADALNAVTVKAKQSWHYPPVIHDWIVPSDENDILKNNDVVSYDIHLRNPMPMDEKVDFLPSTKLTSNGIQIRPHIFRHELLQSFSMHLFAKRPVQPIVDLPSFRRSLARRVALAALQIRLNVGGRSDDPPFSFVEFNQLDSAREGCAVCSLDLTASDTRWKDAIQVAVSEIRKLGTFGVTSGEMERYTSALLTDSAQLAAQGDRISHGDQLAYLMETVANGHTFMSPEQSYTVTEQALSTLTLEEVNHAAKDLCSHVLGLTTPDGQEEQSGVVVVVACTPKTSLGDQDPNYCNEENLIACIRDACEKEISPVEDVHVPHSLIPAEELMEAMKTYPATWEGGRFTDGTPDTPSDKFTRPFTLRRLNNGMRVGIAQNGAESHRGFLRLVAPGGRHAEQRLGLKQGSMSVGARAMQEGGAFGPWTREQVELFCVDHLLMVEINCSEESITIDFVFPTTNVGNTGFGENMELGITGTEATMQIVREILVGFKWEEDALGRSKQSFKSAHDGLQKNLEGLTTERVMESLTNNDNRFLSIDTETVDSITLEDAKKAVMSQLLPPELEVSIVGDFDVVETMEMVRKYLGTIPEDVNSEYFGQRDAEVVIGSVPPLPLLAGKRHIELELTDSDPRAVAYVAGRAPNMWGYLEDGTTVPERIMAADKGASEYDKKRRSHPLFANAALSLVSEIVNRRLFSYVRERKQLTYDANFSLTGFERLMGGWFLVTVTASKENAQAALEACKETLESLRKSQTISEDNLESARRVVLNRHEGELRTARYWAEMMNGLQQESIPLKGPLSITDFQPIVESITTKDLQLCLECLGLDEAQLYTAIGKTVQPAGIFPEDEKLVKANPMVGMSRGGPLFN